MAAAAAAAALIFSVGAMQESLVDRTQARLFKYITDSMTKYVFGAEIEGVVRSLLLTQGVYADDRSFFPTKEELFVILNSFLAFVHDVLSVFKDKLFAATMVEPELKRMRK